ncbi:MAG: dihydrodipicolinate synthase family protein, partial [Clostridia bacterium]|nr:dihydrodipicolinate synthase family protein [Clostridia bacterium]
AMPELFLKLVELLKNGELETARKLQNDVNNIIYKLCSAKGNMYAVIKATLKKREGLELGGVRAPLANLVEADGVIVDEAVEMINAAIEEYIK